MILGGVDIYLTNLTTVYLPVYGLPVLLSLTVYVLTMLVFKMWIVDHERKEVLVLPPRHTGNTVYYTPRNEQPLNRASLRPRRSNRRTNRRRPQPVERTSINFEAELDKPYGKALKVIYSDEEIKQALVYMNQKGKYNVQSPVLKGHLFLVLSQKISY